MDNEPTESCSEVTLNGNQCSFSLVRRRSFRYPIAIFYEWTECIHRRYLPAWKPTDKPHMSIWPYLILNEIMSTFCHRKCYLLQNECNRGSILLAPNRIESIVAFHRWRCKRCIGWRMCVCVSCTWSRSFRIEMKNNRVNKCEANCVALVTCLNEILHSWLLLLMSLFTSFDTTANEIFHVFSLPLQNLQCCRPATSSSVHSFDKCSSCGFIVSFACTHKGVLHRYFHCVWPMLFCANKLINRIASLCLSLWECALFFPHIRYASKFWLSSKR